MKRKKFLVGLLSAMALLLVSCSNEGQTPVSAPADQPQTWTVVSSGEAPAIDEGTPSNRAISIGGPTGIRLYTNWEAGDVIKVFNSTGTQVGTLTVTVDPQNASLATFSGTVTGEYTAGVSTLTYYYIDKAQTFTGQNGTLAYVSTNCNYMKAVVTVTEVDADNHVLHMGFAAFQRNEAMAIFKFKDEAGNWLRPDRVVITAQSGKLITSIDADGTEHYGPLTINVAAKDGMQPYELFVALKNGNKLTNETYLFTVYQGYDIYESTEAASSKFVRTDVYDDGQYYTQNNVITLPMLPVDAGLSNTIGDWSQGTGITDETDF